MDLNPNLLIIFFGTHGSYTLMSLVKGNNNGYKDLARSPKPTNPIFFSDNKDAFKLLSKPYFSLLLIKLI